MIDVSRGAYLTLEGRNYLSSTQRKQGHLWRLMTFLFL